MSKLQQKFGPPHPVQGSEEACENLRKAARTGLEYLDAVDLLEVWKVRPTLMQSVPDSSEARTVPRCDSVGHHQRWRRTRRSVAPDEGLEASSSLRGCSSTVFHVVEGFKEEEKPDGGVRGIIVGHLEKNGGTNYGATILCPGGSGISHTNTF